MALGLHSSSRDERRRQNKFCTRVISATCETMFTLIETWKGAGSALREAKSAATRSSRVLGTGAERICGAVKVVETDAGGHDAER